MKGATQRAVLDVLRANAPRWITPDELARAVYGAAGDDERRAIRSAVCRMRQAGLAVEGRASAPFLPTAYRLEVRGVSPQ